MVELPISISSDQLLLILIFYKTCFLNEEVTCTGLSLHKGFPDYYYFFFQASLFLGGLALIGVRKGFLTPSAR
jgi:hypothetical protein